MGESERGRPGNEVIEGQVIRLDYGRFEKKAFYKCTLIYAGGLAPALISCDFIESTFAFEGPALQTVQFMAAIAQVGDDGKSLIMAMLGITSNG